MNDLYSDNYLDYARFIAEQDPGSEPRDHCVGALIESMRDDGRTLEALRAAELTELSDAEFELVAEAVAAALAAVPRVA